MAPPTFSRLLASLGGSPWLESQVETVAALGRALGASLTILHVAPPGANAAAVHARVEAALALAGTTAEWVAAVDRSPHRTILREVERRGIDLLYAGAAAHEPLVKDLVGSTARRLARSARCSVLLDAAPVGRGGRFPLAVVAINLDPEGRQAAQFALALRRSGVVAEVHLVYEALPAPPSALRGDAQQAQAVLRARADAELRDFVAQLGPDARMARARVVEGRDLAGIAAYARKVEANLVLCRGPRARRFTFWRWFGSEHEALLTDLPSSLLLLRPEALARPKR